MPPVTITMPALAVALDVAANRLVGTAPSHASLQVLTFRLGLISGASHFQCIRVGVGEGGK